MSIGYGGGSDGNDDDDFDFGLSEFDGSERKTTAAFLAAESLTDNAGGGFPWCQSDSFLPPLPGSSNLLAEGDDFCLGSDDFVNRSNPRPQHPPTPPVARPGRSPKPKRCRGNSQPRCSLPIPLEAPLGCSMTFTPPREQSTNALAPHLRSSPKLLPGLGVADAVSSSVLDGSPIDGQRQGSTTAPPTRDAGCVFGHGIDGATGVAPGRPASLMTSIKVADHQDGGNAGSSNTEPILLVQAAQSAPLAPPAAPATTMVHVVSPDVAKIAAVEAVVSSTAMGVDTDPKRQKVTKKMMTKTALILIFLNGCRFLCMLTYRVLNRSVW